MDQENKITLSSVIKKIFKAICICIILTVYIIIFVRFFTSCDSEIVDTLLKTPEIEAAYENSPDTFEIHSYELTDWYKSKPAADDESGNAGKLLSIDKESLYHIPQTKNLQFALKFNLDILENRQAEYSENNLPFRMYLEDEAGNIYESYSAAVYDEKYSFGYIRINFDNISLVKEDGSLDEDGDPARKNYELYLHMMDEEGNYKEEVYDQFSIYTGKKYYGNIRYK
ncbi:MAG: hypothetical protein E7621_05400 [Ruminococcaceae bacterium]|nr:hypothetical protein [Oscillospiraceae bacterium]